MSRLSTAYRSLRSLPGLHQTVFVLERSHQNLQESAQLTAERLSDLQGRVDTATATLAAVEANLNALHATVSENDPVQVYEIVTAVRDDVRKTLVEITEQGNRQRDVLSELMTRAATPQ